MRFQFVSMLKLVFLAASLTFIVMSTGCCVKKKLNPTKLVGNLSIVGSSSTQEVCDALADAFMKKHREIEVVKSGAGSAQAAIAVASNVAQIGDLSRKMQQSEHPENFDIHTFAIDGIAICTNKKNNIKNLSSSQLKEIFSGKITNWNEINQKNGAIVVLGRDEASGTRTSFENIIGEKNSCKYLIIQDNNGKIKEKIKNDENAIGYISFSSVDDSINPVAIDGAKPSFENILNSTYKLSHPFIQICQKNSSDELVNSWFNFIYSKEGKKIIKNAKLIPVSENF